MHDCFMVLLCVIGYVTSSPLGVTSSSYDLDEIISQVNLQFCTIVEIGQGYCSLFLEFRTSPRCTNLSRDNVAEVFLGSCECSTLRSWEYCSIPLRKARPYECSFEEGVPTANSSTRVHRRFCDPTFMVQVNEPCDCSKQFAQRTIYPVEGFLTCYRAPLPQSICSTHSVCGVARCAAKSLFGLSLVQCDPNCLGGQPFCEAKDDISSKPPVVTSIWSDWTACKRGNIADNVQIDEAICLEDKTQAPAFDCLGPGSYCCPRDIDQCYCEVSTTMAEMKVTRFIGTGDLKKKRNTLQKSLKKKRYILN